MGSAAWAGIGRKKPKGPIPWREGNAARVHMQAVLAYFLPNITIVLSKVKRFAGNIAYQ